MREFERFLQKYGVDERLDVVDGPDGNPTLYFKDKRLIPFSQACSSGTLMLLLLFCCFFVRGAERDASFLYIDDFDAYLHFEATEQLVSYFGSVAECQTICTTHSTSLVKNQIMRPDCVFAIRLRDAEEGDPGETFITSLVDSTNREIRLINNVEHLLRNGEFE